MIQRRKREIMMSLKMTNEIKLTAAGQSECGPNRHNNQDAIYFDIGMLLPTSEELGLFIVCDGLGGHQAGGLASRLAISVIVSTISSGASTLMGTDGRLDGSSIRRLIRRAITAANKRLVTKSEQLDNYASKMGTTITMAMVYDNVAYIANAGDSRLYLIRKQRTYQITNDHSLAAELARQGHISHEEIATHPRNNVLSKALGIQDAVEPDLYEVHIRPGDRLFLCSDGLWKAFPLRADFNGLLTGEAKPAEIVQLLVNEAITRDGSDNVSGVLVEAIPGEQAEATRSNSYVNEAKADMNGGFRSIP